MSKSLKFILSLIALAAIVVVGREYLGSGAEGGPEQGARQTDRGVGAEASATTIAAPDAGTGCGHRAAIYRPVFTDRVQGRSPLNRLVSFGPERAHLVFFTEVIGAAGAEIIHRWILDDVPIADYSLSVERDRWPTWSRQIIDGADVGTLRVEVYERTCLLGQATIRSGNESAPETPVAGGWMRPTQALEVALAKPDVDDARTASRSPFVDDLTDNGDTLLLAAIRSGDTAEALKLINRVEAPDPPARMSMDEANAFLGRHYRRADPFLRGPDGVSPIDLAHQLGQDTIVEALIQSAITVHRDRRGKNYREKRFSDSLINTLMSNEGGFTRFDDGDTPLHRAVRTNNERAVLTMLRLPGFNEQTDPYNPPVDIYAYDADGRQALTIARQKGFYAIERFLSLAMTRKSPGWAVSRSAFATHMKGGEPGDCRKVAFEDEKRLHFFTELSDMDGKRIAHEWLHDGQPVQRSEFDVAGRRWLASSSRDFSPAEIGLWDVRVVTESGEVLRTERLHYRELTQYNRKNRDRMLGPCNIGVSAFYALVKANAPIADLEYLIAKGMELKLDGAMGKDLVSQAILDGNIPLIGWFLERGLDLGTYVTGAETPLLLAVNNGNAAMALYLITRGADIRFKRNRDGQSALQLSASAGNTELAELLLAHGADPNAANDRGYTPLHAAVRKCDMPTTLVLLKHGADPGRKNDAGEAPRDIVAQCDRMESWDPRQAGLSALYAG